ncbi:MAG: citramalate synthase [bacterium]
MSDKVLIYDTTLRDGTQAEGVSLSVEDKLRITRKLDEMGIDYIEGGWPSSNPKDMLFFKKVKDYSFAHTRIAAFSSTRNPRHAIDKDTNIQGLLEAETTVVTIFGKSWDLHVTDALGIPLEQNLDIIRESVAYLKARVAEVIYDAEHFFDGYKRNPAYAMKSLLAAEEGGADCLVLCDTNGGTMPFDLERIIADIQKRVRAPLGIHTHNDSETAVANSILAVTMGIRHVQGTINGYGERCGNANLCSIIPNIQLKMGLTCISPEQLRQLRETSRFVSEIANLKHWGHQPFVGDSAFAHKGGIHVSAIRKNKLTYEHIDPELVGNHQRILVSELSGRSNVLSKAAEYQINLAADRPEVQRLVRELKELENQGFQFEGAEASFELLMRKVLGTYSPYFDLVGFRVIVERREGDEQTRSEATIKVKVKGIEEHTAADGNGPVNALDNALRKALEEFFPDLREVNLIDYKVRILEGREGTGARTRVLIESADPDNKWGTVGVSDNIIEASWQALVDSIEYKLLKDEDLASRANDCERTDPDQSS